MGNKNGTPVLREQDIAALSKSSGMDAAQVKEHFNAFLTAHPNGKMKPKEFREMVEKTMPKSDASKMEKHVFRIYDSNNDGYIDFVEFMLIFHTICQLSYPIIKDIQFSLYISCIQHTINLHHCKLDLSTN